MIGHQYRHQHQTNTRDRQVRGRDGSGLLQKCGRMGTRHPQAVPGRERRAASCGRTNMQGRLVESEGRHPKPVQSLGTPSGVRHLRTSANPKTGFDSFPPSTKRMILLVSERDSQGGVLARPVPSRPVPSFVDILALSYVAYVQNHIHHFLRNTKGRDAFIQMGFCAAIRTAYFLADAPDRPGAFSHFCCGPQTLARSSAAGRDSLDHASTLVQMQLKTTDTTTGFSEKDIKSMTKLNFTVPHDFHELARLLENMAGILRAPFGSLVPAHAHAGRMEPLPDARR